jgi:hypothetical protein
MNKRQRDLLVFGYGLGVIALVFAAGGIIKHGPGWPQVVLLACAAVFFPVTIFCPRALGPGYRGWMRVAHGIGAVVTTIILTLVFYLVFTPVALFLRLIRKDHLERRFDPSASTYWHTRPQGERPAEDYLRQF